MPISQFTSSVAIPAIDTEVSFGTIVPNFDRLDVYVDPGPASGVTRLIWRLYSTVGGVTTKIAELGPLDAASPYRPFAGIGINPSGDPNSADLFDLRAVAVDAPIVGVKAGMIGYDTVVNTQPIELSSNVAVLVANAEVTFGTLNNYHDRVQVQVDPGAAIYAGSRWTIYGQITGIAGPIAAPVGAGDLPSLPNALAPVVVASAMHAGATTYIVKAKLTDLNYDGTPVSASVSGSDPQLDNAGGGGGGITQLTQDVLAGPGAGVQTASVVQATGEVVPFSGGTWALPVKSSSFFFYRDPAGGATTFVRIPGAYGSNPFGGYSFLSADDARNVVLGYGGFVAGCNALTLESPVTYINRAGRLVAKTVLSQINNNQSLWWIQQPDLFGNIEPYAGGAGAFTCDTGLYATSFIECQFAGGAGGTINLPGNFAEGGRVLHIGDGLGNLSVVNPLVLVPSAMDIGPCGINGGAPGVPLTITTPGWTGKLVLNSTRTNWMIF